MKVLFFVSILTLSVFLSCDITYGVGQELIDTQESMAKGIEEETAKDPLVERSSEGLRLEKQIAAKAGFWKECFSPIHDETVLNNNTKKMQQDLLKTLEQKYPGSEEKLSLLGEELKEEYRKHIIENEENICKNGEDIRDIIEKHTRDSSVDFLFNQFISQSHFFAEEKPYFAALRRAVIEEFQLKDSYLRPNQEMGVYKKHVPVLRMIVRCMYENTQAYFKSMNIDSIDLVRGIDLPISYTPGYYSMPTSPLCSFTANARHAKIYTQKSEINEEREKYYGYLQFQTVPIERILSTGHTGWGMGELSEFIVLGSSTGTDTVYMEPYTFSWKTLED